MPKIIITPLSGLIHSISTHNPSHVVSLLPPEHMIDTPEGVHPDRHLKIGISDAAEPSFQDDHVQDLLDFVRLWEATSPLLINCWAGISRSTAAAYIAVCDRLDHVRESEIAMALRHRAPHAQPDRHMIELADAMLEREGRMIEAIKAIGPGKPAAEGQTVHFPLAFGIS